MQRPILVTFFLIFCNCISAQSESEPNNSISQADQLYHITPGTISPATDTDWYTFKPAIDMRVTLHVVPPTSLPLSVSFYYYKKGILTLISSHTVSAETDVNQGGIGRGQFYVKVAPANTDNTKTGSYSITFDSYLVNADIEPNNTYINARILPLGDSAKGHVNYYGTTDTVDFYRITTTNDGDLNINLHSYSGTTMITLLGARAKTYITSLDNTISDSLKIYGLSAGNYYLSLKSVDSNTYSDYRLVTNIDNYIEKTESEPNNLFQDAQTIPVNDTATGTINYYSPTKADTVDYWKINYTGSTGNMQLSFYPEPTIPGSTISPVLFEVYKETYKPPLYSNYFSSASGDIHLKGLTAGLYYIKVKGGGQPYAYSIIDSFAQTKVDLKITDKSAKVVCTNKNFITVKILGQAGPYTLEKYDLNELQSKFQLENSLPYTFSDIPAGIYKFRGYADGATGHAIDSEIVYFLPVPATLTSYNITNTTATVEWNKPYCATYFSIQYRRINTSTWTTVTTGDTYFYNFINLTPATTYEWQVATGDSANGVSGIGAYSILDSFTTASSFSAMSQSENFSSENIHSNRIIVYPNPAQTQFVIQYNTAQKIAAVSLTLKNLNGITVWSKNNIPATAVSGSKVYVDNIPSGVYVLTMRDQNSNLIESKKIIISR